MRGFPRRTRSSRSIWLQDPAGIGTGRENETARKVSDRLSVIVHHRRSDPFKSRSGVKRVRHWIRRVGVDFTECAIVPGAGGVIEEDIVTPASKAASSRRGGDNNAVQINKSRVAVAKPCEVRSVMIGVLIDGLVAAARERQKRVGREMGQTFRLEPGQLQRMRALRVRPKSSRGLT